jgi:type III restriction enzyme
VEFELRSYQTDAARAVLEMLERALDDYRGKYASRSWFSLSAMPSAGKTVIAAAVIEALFRGADEWGNEPDPHAVVLWLTDDESLNNQTKKKMFAASELAASQLVSIDSPHFSHTLDAQTVYFLNVQKLYSGSTNYTKPTQDRPYSLWDAIQNTIDAEHRNLYLVIDEAHKGMGQEQGRATTVQRLINGDGDRSPVPIVWGISATTARFSEAMGKVTDRTHLPDYEVPIEEVRASGLLKDRVILRHPASSGHAVDTSILRHAVRYMVEQSEQWADYCQSQNRDLVLPLLLVQVENDPAAAEIARIISAIQEEWETNTGQQLAPHAIAHVFGDKTDIGHAGRIVRHVPPESVQDLTDIRILIAKNAVTTGWDCPRAEVLVSLRGSDDSTVITQLMGRMFRTPLAERVPGRDSLNTAICLLPRFNRKKTDSVAEMLQKGNGSTTGGMDATDKPIATLTRNPSVATEVFDLFTALPSESKPDPLAKPIPRLFSMATALAGDGLLATASARAHALLFSKLDGQLSEQAAAVAQARENVVSVKLAGTVVSLTGKGTSADDGMVIRGDARAVDAAFSAAARSFTKGLTIRYEKHRAEKVAEQTGEEMDLIAAKLDVAALGTVSAVADVLSAAAVKQVQDWFDTYDAALLALSDERQAAYDRIRATGPAPMRRHTKVPDNVVVDTADQEGGDPHETVDRHLLSDEYGQYPINFKSAWEQRVVETELGRRGAGEVVGWYRNPSYAVETAFRVPYLKADGTWSSFQPDFVFFSRKADGSLAASLIEPHRDQGDTLLKLRGWSDFVERYPDTYLRAEFISANKSGELNKLSLNDAATRAAIRAATDAKSLFDGPHPKS